VLRTIYTTVFNRCLLKKKQKKKKKMEMLKFTIGDCRGSSWILTEMFDFSVDKKQVAQDGHLSVSHRHDVHRIGAQSICFVCRYLYTQPPTPYIRCLVLNNNNNNACLVVSITVCVFGVGRWYSRGVTIIRRARARGRVSALYITYKS